MITLLPHNQSAFNNIINLYNTGTKKIIYVSGVGTGKSFVFLAVAERVAGKILYVLPKHAIRENIEAYGDFSAVGDKVSFVTFNQFTSVSKGKEIISGYDMVVIDECHHLGSDIYGRALLDVMSEDHDTFFLGLTATPVRFKMNTLLPDGTIEKNVDVSRFFDERVDGISNFDAIRLGLMPPFQYRLLEPDKDPKQIEKEYGYEVKAVVDYKNESRDIVDEIIHTYSRDKWICFFSSTKDLKKHEGSVKAMFPGYKVLLLYSDLKNLKEVMEETRSNDKVVILSVNMLLEGVHLSGITGIILYRNVSTVSTFQQILGRVCSIGNKVEPLVVDCSRCGPALLRQLLKEGDEGVGNWPPRGNFKPIMSIGIGLHKGWEQIDTFLARIASLKAKQGRKVLDEDTRKKILSDYHALGGNHHDDFSSLSKQDESILKACCWKYDINPKQLMAM